MYNPHADYVSRVDQRDFIQGVPYQVPFLPQVPINNPQLQQGIGLIVGYVIHEVQSRATANQIRAQMFLSCAQNQWRSQTFTQTVAMAVEVVDLFVSTQRMVFEDACKAAASQVCLIMSVDLASQTGLLQQDPSMHQAANQAMDMAQRLKQQIGLMYNQRSGASMGMGGTYPMGGGYPPQTGFYPNNGMMSNQFGMGPPPMSPSNVMGVAGPIHSGVFVPAGTPTRQQHQSSGFVGVHATRQPTQAVVTHTRPSIEEANFMNSPAPLAGAFRSLPGARAQNVAPEVNELVSETLPDSSMESTEQPFNMIVLTDGSKVRPAVFSPDLKPTLSTEEQPYRRVYDASQHVLFYVQKPTGEVLEILQERTDDMEYMKHELDTRARKSVVAAETAVSTKKIAPDWALAQSFKPHPTLAITARDDEFLEIEESQGSDDDEVVEVEFSERIETVSSLTDAEIKAALYAAEALKDGKAFEAYFEIAERVQTDIGELETIFDTIVSPDYSAAAKALMQMSDEGAEEVKVTIARLDALLTDEINRILQRDLSLDGWAVDSFMADIDDLSRMLGERFGESIAVKFKQTAERTLNAFFGISIGNRNLIGYRAAIYWVPWTTGDLSLDFNSGGMIDEAALPAMHSAVAEMMQRTEERDVSRRFLLTEDAKIFEIRKGLLANNCYLIHQVEE